MDKQDCGYVDNHGVAIAGLTVLATVAYSVRELRRTEQTEEDEDAG